MSTDEANDSSRANAILRQNTAIAECVWGAYRRIFLGGLAFVQPKPEVGSLSFPIPQSSTDE